MLTQTLVLAGLNDKQCAIEAEQALSALDGVKDVSVSFKDGKAAVTFDSNRVSLEQFRSALQPFGYDAAIYKPKHGEDGNCCGGCGG